ncbi:uncharacterized protein [Apostichopus japonicus]|uniref:uncharacterized protein isoform X1 n=1 Tax=Stichopus japonicus TaxID=307972 RepID=UPI003AB6ABCC
MPVEERMDSLVHSDTLGMISGSTNNETKPMDTCGVPRFYILVVIVFVVFVSMLAIILSSVAIGRSPKSFSDTDTAATNDYVWTFAAGHSGHALEYIDERSGQLRGFSIDLVNAVCQEADKYCEIIWDFYENCWDSGTGMAAHGGQGLLGRWYDGCTAWANTANRQNTFKFSDQYLTDLN